MVLVKGRLPFDRKLKHVVEGDEGRDRQGEGKEVGPQVRIWLTTGVPS